MRERIKTLLDSKGLPEACLAPVAHLRGSLYPLLIQLRCGVYFSHGQD